MSNPAAALAEFLDAKAAEVKNLETRAQALLSGTPDQPGYEALMREKATLLSNITEDAEDLVDALPKAKADDVAARLEQFSGNAAMSLKIGSVFFMSALLYPDEHKPGEPNNLELLAAEVRGWA
jgi:hypothetical protein